MKYKTKKQYRLPGYDYSWQGEYFVTICVKDRINYLGEINNGEMNLSGIGKIADQTWNKIPQQFKNISLDVYQIMPDHFHGIVVIKENRNLVKHENQWNLMKQIPTVFKSGIINNPMELKTISLGRIIRWYKGLVKYESAKINPDFKWQPRFHDRIIRDEKEYYFISEYIIHNPENWGKSILKKYLDES